MEKILKVFRAEVKEIDTEKHTITTIVSTKKVDRDGDIVLPEAFKKRIKTYKEHPVFLSSHSYNDLRKQIGQALDIKISDEAVMTKFEYFVGQGNPEADWAWVLAQKGIASFSIGFMGHEFEWLKEKDRQGNEHITGRKFTEIELLEISQVLIPSNRGALQLGVSMGKESAELCELAIKSIEKGELKIDGKDLTAKHYSDNLPDNEPEKGQSKSKEEVGIEKFKSIFTGEVSKILA